jgi:tRNA-2-methylthio-N6-dimethylallyladenosine synthase
LDVAHLARYSPRIGTVSERSLIDDVPNAEKWRRFRALEKLQENVVREIHAGYLNTVQPILFEEKVKKRWKGRTPTNKLVFVETEENLLGQVRNVHIKWTGPWSMLGDLA